MSYHINMRDALASTIQERIELDVWDSKYDNGADFTSELFGRIDENCDVNYLMVHRKWVINCKRDVEIANDMVINILRDAVREKAYLLVGEEIRCSNDNISDIIDEAEDRLLGQISSALLSRNTVKIRQMRSEMDDTFHSVYRMILTHIIE